MTHWTRLFLCTAALLAATGCALVPARVPNVRSVTAPLEITGQTTHLDCADPLRSDTCAFATEATVRNPTDAPIDGTLELSGFRVSDTRVEIAGRLAAPIENQLLDTHRHIALAAGDAQTVRIRGRVQNAVGLLTFEAPLYVRHRLLAPESSRALRLTLPLVRNGRARDFYCLIRIDVPEGQHVELRPRPPLSLLAASEEHPVEHEDAPPLSIADACAQPELEVRVPAVERAVSGGPLLAAMIVSSSDNPRPDRFAARVGWEWGLVEWLVGSVNLESDFRESVTLVPLVEVATNGIRVPSEAGTESFYALPSASIGLGVPIRVGDATSVGARIEAGVAFPLVRAFAFWDLRFARSGSGSGSTPPFLGTGAGIALSL